MSLALIAVDPLAMLKWFHFLLLAMAGGGAIVALLLSGFEAERPDLQGLAATVWKRTTTWGFRLAVIVGILLLTLKIQKGDHPFDESYLHIKLVLVVFLLGAAEMAPKLLAKGKRGAAMLALLLFMATSFVVFNKALFPSKAPAPQVTAPAQVSALVK